MGYNTNYKLKIETEDSSIEDDIWNFIIIEEGKHGSFYGISSRDDYNDSCKWYEHEEEMKHLSKKFPTVLFTLFGEGEDSGDIWRKYFKGGKMQRANAIITFEEYDENKLS